MNISHRTLAILHNALIADKWGEIQLPWNNGVHDGEDVASVSIELKSGRCQSMTIHRFEAHGNGSVVTISTNDGRTHRHLSDLMGMELVQWWRWSAKPRTLSEVSAARSRSQS